MTAKNWRTASRRRTWLAVGIALLFLASVLSAEGAGTKPTKRRVPNNAKAAAKKANAAETPLKAA